MGNQMSENWNQFTLDKARDYMSAKRHDEVSSDMLQTFETLISMGFPDNASFEAVKIYPHQRNIYKAIDWISKNEHKFKKNPNMHTGNKQDEKNILPNNKVKELIKRLNQKQEEINTLQYTINDQEKIITTMEQKCMTLQYENRTRYSNQHSLQQSLHFIDEFIYRRAQQDEYAHSNILLVKEIHNIGIIESIYGEYSHHSTGFIIGHSSQLNTAYVLTSADAVINWIDEKNNKYGKIDNVSFRLTKNTNDNNEVMPYDEISKYEAINWKIYPKYLKEKSQKYNIAIITLHDPKNELLNVKPLKLTGSTKNYECYQNAKVFGFGGVWGEELFGVKGNIYCKNGKIITYKNIICRGSGGPIFCDGKNNINDENKIEIDNVYVTMKKLLNLGLDIDCVWNAMKTRNSVDFEVIYNYMNKGKEYEPSEIDRGMYNQKDKEYDEIFSCFNNEIIGVSLGESGVLLYDELLEWIEINSK
eukprot:274074_1